jgi:hypothetical protein
MMPICLIASELDRPPDQPAGVAGQFVDAVRFVEVRPTLDQHHEAQRDQEEQMPEQRDPVVGLGRQVAGDNVDADVFLAKQGVARAHQEDHAEQIPLPFEPGVRTRIEHLADDRVDRADQHDHQDKPVNGSSNELVEAVDRRAHFEKSAHNLRLPTRNSSCSPPRLGRVRVPAKAIIIYQNWVAMEPIFECFPRNDAWIAAGGGSRDSSGRVQFGPAVRPE